MVRRYVGKERLPEFRRDVEQVSGGTLSVTAATVLLRLPYSHIDRLIEERQARAWAFYLRVGDTSPTHFHIASHDIIRHGIRVGRIGRRADLADRVAITEEEFTALAEEAGREDPPDSGKG